jgi:uncharacterized tellurite resistance protein B-like protein
MSVLHDHSPDFYTFLSSLFYAIAASDHTISRKEKEEIIRLVDEHWAIKNENINSKEIIYASLKKLIFEKVDVENAFKQFASYFNQNPELFPSTVKETIMTCSYDIANAYARRNKSELVLLSRLHCLLFDGQNCK